jgi:dihydroxy-acid dehydratase
MAKSVGVPLTQDDFQKISDRVPVLADFKPSGKYLMEDLHNKGGVPAVMKYLLKEGLINGNCLTVTGKTIAENLKDVPDLNFEEQDIIYPLENPLKKQVTCKSYTEILQRKEVLLKSVVKKEKNLKVPQEFSMERKN